MRAGRRRILALVVVGAVIAAIPALASSAGSSTAKVVTESLKWSPKEVAITPGGTVTFQNPSTTVPHGIVWQSGPETPSCSGVPVNAGATAWEGTCTFAMEGVYDYYCYVHGTAMSGVVYVNAAGTVPSTTTTTSSTATSQSSTMTSMSMSSMTTTASGGSGAGGMPSSGDSLKGNAVHLPARQRGSRIRGSVQVARRGSTLIVEALAPAAQLASVHRRRVRVGRLVRRSLPRGRASFSVALNAKAARALRRRGHLVVSVRLTLLAPGGARSRRTLPVLLHEP